LISDDASAARAVDGVLEWMEFKIVTVGPHFP